MHPVSELSVADKLKIQMFCDQLERANREQAIELGKGAYSLYITLQATMLLMIKKKML
jgi:hypothetical protein